MNSWFFWLLFILGCGMVLAIYYGFLDKRLKYPLLFLLSAGIGISTIMYKLDFGNMGFRTPTIQSVTVYAIVTVIVLLIAEIGDLRKQIMADKQQKSDLQENMVFYFILGVPFQEIMARGYILAVFRHFEWNSLTFYIIFSAFVFSFSHFFLKNIYFTSYTFLLGLVWAFLFYFYPDLLSISVSHFVLGSVILGSRYTQFKNIFSFRGV